MLRLLSTQMLHLGQMKVFCLWRCPQFGGFLREREGRGREEGGRREGGGREGGMEGERERERFHCILLSPYAGIKATTILEGSTIPCLYLN